MNARLSTMVFAFCLLASQFLGAGEQPVTTSVRSLDGSWLLAIDAKNVGRKESWFSQPRAGGQAGQGAVDHSRNVSRLSWRGLVLARVRSRRPTRIAGGRYLLRFWQVDYLAEVWLNGAPVGGHEGGETPFVLDVTDHIKPGQSNRLAVRVLNPTQRADRRHLPEPDGPPLQGDSVCRRRGLQSRRNHRSPWNCFVRRPLYVDDLYAVRPAGAEGRQASREGRRAQRDDENPRRAPERHGFARPAAAKRRPPCAWNESFRPAISSLEADLTIDNPHLWQLNDPYLYRVTARRGRRTARIRSTSGRRAAVSAISASATAISVSMAGASSCVAPTPATIIRSASSSPTIPISCGATC